MTRVALASSPFQIGAHSIGVPRVHGTDEDAKLTIGRFCTLGDDVQIFLGGFRADADRQATYPFAARFGWTDIGAVDGRPDARGDAGIGHDVSVAGGAVIRPGVTVGNGAIIRSGAAVSEDIPPYAVVAGDPAIVLRSRSEPGMISVLQEIQ